MSRAILSALLVLGCGGPWRPAQTASSDEDDEDSIVEEEDEGAPREGFVDEAALRDASTPLALGDPVGVPGTGVTMRPPSGAAPMPHGAGFLSVEQRFQITVIVALGPAALLDSVRGERARAEPGSEEDVTVAGQTGRVGRDRLPTPAGELERGWLLVHDGRRGLAIVATYEAGRSGRVWPALRESFGSLEWDRDATLDPALALGLDVAAVQGFTPSPSTTANVVLLGRGASYPPEPGQPFVTISPLPLQLASDQSRSVCEQIVARLMPVPTRDIEHEGAIENGPLPGCERLATAENEGRRLATYMALVFAGATPILVTGSVDAAQLRTWRGRFSSAARAVRPRS